MIAHCTCGTVFWAELPFSSCPRCDAPAIVRAQVETLEEFEERILASAVRQGGSHRPLTNRPEHLVA